MATKRFRKNRGSAMMTAFGLMAMVSIVTGTYVSSATQSLRQSKREALDIQTSAAAEAAIEQLAYSIWQPFKAGQTFTNLDAALVSSTSLVPGLPQSVDLGNGVRASVGVIAYSTPSGDPQKRNIKVRTVSWRDTNLNGLMDSGEPQKIVDRVVTLQLSRSNVFDYTYFVNNYGWMDGFSQNTLVVNGDMRANGNFSFSNGTPTVNGSVYAAPNANLSPAAAGTVSGDAVQWTNSQYQTTQATNSRMRPGYDPIAMGTPGSTTYSKWQGLIYNANATELSAQPDGAVFGDATGIRSRSTVNGATGNVTSSRTLLDQNSTKELPMPDLSDLSVYTTRSSTYVDPKATFADGTTNPGYNQGAYLDIWDTTAGAYKRITTSGVVTGSAAVVGTSDHPVKIHGPVTFTQDVLIKGYVSGQGTIYTGRNVHIVGSVIYKSPPDFRGSDPTTVDATNEKKDMLGLAARGSVIMGDTTAFNDSYPLTYMTPPFTKGRYDANGNWVAPFDAKQVDDSGRMRYQTVMGDTTMHSLSSSVDQIDAVVYTNFVGGGDIGVGGSGVQFNGSIISKDEAMVVFSLPMTMNFDNRIRDRISTGSPLIDISLPRAPKLVRQAWQDKGFTYFDSPSSGGSGSDDGGQGLTSGTSSSPGASGSTPGGSGSSSSSGSSTSTSSPGGSGSSSSGCTSGSGVSGGGTCGSGSGSSGSGSSGSGSSGSSGSGSGSGGSGSSSSGGSGSSGSGGGLLGLLGQIVNGLLGG